MLAVIWTLPYSMLKKSFCFTFLLARRLCEVLNETFQFLFSYNEPSSLLCSQNIPKSLLSAAIYANLSKYLKVSI